MSPPAFQARKDKQTTSETARYSIVANHSQLFVQMIFSSTSFLRPVQLLSLLWFVLMDPALVVVTAAAAAATVPEDSIPIPFLDGDPNLLFLGNSYIHIHNLPHLVQTLLEEGVPEWKGRIHIRQRDPGGERFSSHVQAMMQPGSTLHQWLMTTSWSWKWVCLQEQSQIPGLIGLGHDQPDFAASLVAVQHLQQQIHKKGGHTLLLLTWARRSGDDHNRDLFPDFITMQDLLLQGYIEYWKAASATETAPVYLAPIGLVYETLYKDAITSGHDPTTDPETFFYQLYHHDGSHPSLTGSFVAALTIYTTMTGLNPNQVVACPPGLHHDVCVNLQNAVYRTLQTTVQEYGYQFFPWKSSSWAILSESTTSDEL